MINGIIGLLSVIFFAYYIMKLRKNKFDTRTMVIVSMFSALSYILYLIQFIKYPQGGGISLFSMLPVMLLSLIYGNAVGLTGGLIFGFLKLLNGYFIVHPIQFLLDYILSTMMLGIAGSFGNHKKVKVILGCLLAVFVSVNLNVLSGVIFFGQYAPEGMNVWWYSIVYNYSSAGLEGVLTTIIIGLMPLKKFISLGKGRITGGNE
ncbi:energy-coupled thiamine transporter ThiT [Anaeromicrobium sediminis]|uniref:Energy-coupled thiamine transporter ThiT n=1 Tax=Anaeromicrobium sediminis TaxID=1478221 RepID=A0A267MKA7_9FIRM|nr:energy-coupled thiamine transporter ThiT [Anaeromicrobium sediminis]PAB60009.1 energy-coupled thiamine transporter ThiT [Anaeromicrobium sediminis]